MIEFVGDDRHFKADKLGGEIQLSKWYGPKFLNHPDRPVKGDNPEHYLTGWAEKDVCELLESSHYKLKIIEWDWKLNEK